MLPGLGCQCAEHVAYALSLTGQQEGDAVGTVAIGQGECLAEVVVGIGEQVLLMHHRHLEQILVRAGVLEVFHLGLLGIELLRPGSLEVDGVEQIADGSGRELVLAEHLLYHLLRVVAGPLVDGVEGLAVAEVAGFGRGQVVVVGLLHEVRVQRVILIQEDGVGNHHLRQLVEVGGLCEHLLAEGVDAVGSCVAEAEGLVDLCQGLAGSSVVEHTQGVGDADGRENLILQGIARTAEEVEGEVVVAVHQVHFGSRQFDVLDRIVLGVDVLRIDVVGITGAYDGVRFCLIFVAE